MGRPVESFWSGRKIVTPHPVRRILYSTVTGHDTLETPCDCIALAKSRRLFKGIEE